MLIRSTSISSNFCFRLCNVKAEAISATQQSVARIAYIFKNRTSFSSLDSIEFTSIQLAGCLSEVSTLLARRSGSLPPGENLAPLSPEHAAREDFQPPGVQPNGGERIGSRAIPPGNDRR